MKTIWKFPLPLTDNPMVEMPQDALVLDVQIQHGEICLWAVVDGKAPLENRSFFVVGTGHPMPAHAGRYVRTVQQDRFVWHVFEERPSGPAGINWNW